VVADELADRYAELFDEGEVGDESLCFDLGVAHVGFVLLVEGGAFGEFFLFSFLLVELYFGDV
jgi:hypothetical protein